MNFTIDNARPYFPRSTLVDWNVGSRGPYY
jgi:hypothetical protein